MEKLKILLNEKIREKENVINSWSREVYEISHGKEVDPYSAKISRKLKKIAQKYASTLDEIEREIDEINSQIDSN